MWGDRSQLYHRLATLSDAGIPLRQAFHMLAESESHAYCQGFLRAIAVIDAGGDVEDALRETDIFNNFEIMMMAAGERGGRLPQTFARLAVYHEARKKRLWAILSRIAYPFALLHAAVLLPNLVIVVQQGVAAYLYEVCSMLAIIYVVILTPFAVARFASSSPTLAVTWERLLFAVPWLGSFLRKYRLAHAITLWHGLYASGVPLITAVAEAGRASDSHNVQALFSRLRSKLENGLTIPQAVTDERLLPWEIRELICAGAISGQLDKMLLTARDRLDEEADTAMRMFIAAMGTFIFVAVAAFIAWKVISFYAGYFQNIARFY
jgi:type IV pilus assembly protein PilC